MANFQIDQATADRLTQAFQQGAAGSSPDLNQLRARTAGKKKGPQTPATPEQPASAPATLDSNARSDLLKTMMDRSRQAGPPATNRPSSKAAGSIPPPGGV